MRSRGLVVAIAVVLAVLAAVGVIVYTSNIRKDVQAEGTEVIVSSQDIPPNTALDPLIAGGAFRQINVPPDALVDGAITNTDQLRGLTSSAQILQNEQIPIGRVTGAISQLAISEGNVGIGLQIDGSAAVNGYIQQGSSVVLYATFSQGTLVSRQTLKFFLKGSQIARLAQAAGGASNPNLIKMPTDYTMQLVPSVTVIAVQNPPADASSGKPTAGSSTFVLDLSPSDAANVVFAVDHSTLYMGLLPSQNKAGYSQPGVIGPPLARVVGVNKG
jgi:Flp pilus assembly protein CpaB